MPIVTVNPIQQISVRVNQQSQQTVHSTSTFVGSTDVKNQVNTAIQLAQSAYDAANTKLSLSGGIITGDLDVTGNVTSTFIGVIDGGTFL